MATTHSRHIKPPLPTRAAPTPFEMGMLRRWLGVACSVWAERQHLGRLDARALDDIGLTRDDARVESKRAIWDVPPARVVRQSRDVR